QAPSPSVSRRGYALGSAALVLAGGGGLHGLRGYADLPEWVEEGKEPDPKLRDAEGTDRYGEKVVIPTTKTAASGRLRSPSSPRSWDRKSRGPRERKDDGRLKGKSLDDWLDDTDDDDDLLSVKGKEAEEEEEEEEDEEDDDSSNDDDDDDDDSDDSD